MTPSFDPSAAGPASHVLLAFAALPAAAQYGFAIVFGLVIGSFLTVVVHRLPIMLERAWRAEIESAEGGKDAKPAPFNLAVPRSACPHCGHVLRAWENIPVISYLLLRGRCGKCGARVSARYPLIELATALLAAVSLYAFGPDWLAVAAFGLCATLLATSAGRSVAVVTHAYVVAWSVAHALGAAQDAWLRLPVENASLTTLDHNSRGELIVRRFNTTRISGSRPSP